jgi:hypothetical protein
MQNGPIVPGMCSREPGPLLPPTLRFITLLKTWLWPTILPSDPNLDGHASILCKHLACAKCALTLFSEETNRFFIKFFDREVRERKINNRLH